MSIIETILEEDASERRIHYLIREEDGRTFHISFLPTIVEEWQKQLARSGSSVDLDRVAKELAEEIISQQPTAQQLADGFLVTFDNGFATPLAAVQNLRNSGFMAFTQLRPNDAS
jgi:hypothetical protein